MAYPAQHDLADLHIHCFAADVDSATASTSSAYIRAPFRGQINKIYAVQYGAIATGNTTITVTVNGTAIAGTSTFPILFSGSAAGTLTSFLPTALVVVNGDDVIGFTSDHNGSNVCPVTFEIAIRPN